MAQPAPRAGLRAKLAKNPGWFAAPIAIVLVGGIFLYMQCHAQHALQTMGGKPQGAFVVAGPAGSTLVLDDLVAFGRNSGKTASGDRLTAIDVATGAKQGLRIFDDDVDCWPASVGRIWCSTPAGVLLVLEAQSLATIADASELVAKAGLGKAVAGKVLHNGSDATVMLPDGRGAHIDAATLVVREASDTEVRELGPAGGRCATIGSIKLADHDFLTFGPGPRSPLVHAERTYGELPAAPADAPRFLGENGPPSFLRLADPKLWIVRSYSTIDASTAAEVFSRVDAGAHRLWSAELGGTARCHDAILVGTRLVVATRDPEHRALAIDLDTGAIAWRFSF
jgi:hypothetical protein